MAFVFKIISNFTFIHKVEIAETFFFVVHKFQTFQVINLISYSMYKAFFMMGFIFLYILTTNTKRRDNIFLLIYLSIITILFSIYFNSIFHLTTIVLAGFVTAYYYHNYYISKTPQKRLVLTAFTFILLSNVFFLFASTEILFYRLAEMLLLFGFLLIFVSQRVSLKSKGNYNVKKNKTRNNKGPSSRNKRK
jgi:hypothetical protein